MFLRVVFQILFQEDTSNITHYLACTVLLDIVNVFPQGAQAVLTLTWTIKKTLTVKPAELISGCESQTSMK